ncbi:hypothetical protein B5864_13830 [Salmonella enterica]|uniref:Uncharacterized protein n=2 Tax=Salmonella enterica TaxID=28901 RepID=A0A403T246_SALER|nr:hypothetical protein [Salmonella sp. SG203]EAB7739575.1 hypothetical protein [Salmonella enterica subsp. enterica serovar Hadar]EAV6574940.1 hypothetical protein [Salmonella enterica]EBQ9003896.1 hypothetical protein [Salmonella enterica subsp. enterica serovar Blockley]EBR8258969.1 hypothetical protein [Salmonella enterica subsp. enterica serovar Cerro]EBW7251979.1 hypothetical protein [Salmonella enterica subsp. enterica serovar Gatow]EBX7469044.1 hypothetical protein [Salmonella enteric
MRLTNNKKTILSYFEPDNHEWVTLEIGSPPFDVSGVTFLLYGSYHNRHNLESARRTLEAMVKDGLLERIRIRETRNTLHGETTATVIRYGLPGQCAVVRDSDGEKDAIDGECIRLPE